MLPEETSKRCFLALLMFAPPPNIFCALPHPPKESKRNASTHPCNASFLWLMQSCSARQPRTLKYDVASLHLSGSGRRLL